MTNNVVITLHITRATAHAALAALGKLPLDQALQAYTELSAAVGAAETNMVMAQIQANIEASNASRGAEV